MNYIDCIVINVRAGVRYAKATIMLLPWSHGDTPRPALDMPQSGWPQMLSQTACEGMQGCYTHLFVEAKSLRRLGRLLRLWGSWLSPQPVRCSSCRESGKQPSGISQTRLSERSSLVSLCRPWIPVMQPSQDCAALQLVLAPLRNLDFRTMGHCSGPG